MPHSRNSGLNHTEVTEVICPMRLFYQNPCGFWYQFFIYYSRMCFFFVVPKKWKIVICSSQKIKCSSEDTWIKNFEVDFTCERKTQNIFTQNDNVFGINDRKNFLTIGDNSLGKTTFGKFLNNFKFHLWYSFRWQSV